MKKHFITLLIILPLALGVISCSSNDDAPHEHVNPYDKFKGSWSGTFSGGDSGTWAASIDKDGKVTGTITSNSIASATFALSGKISENGTVDMNYTYNNQEIGTMTGTMAESTASGKWESPVQKLEGTWQGSKK